MTPEFRKGNNTDITIVDGLMHKVSRYAFKTQVAKDLTVELRDYVAAFDSEPIEVPELLEASTVPESSERSRVKYVTRLCSGPNLCSLTGDELREGVRSVLGQIASMSTIDNEGTLRTPFDAAANNFHRDHDHNMMVDLFPPLLRRSDGSMPLQNIQFSNPRIRQHLIPYTRGTREGAVLSTLFTALTGDRPMGQLASIARGIDDWCYDVLPQELKAAERGRIRRQIDWRFMPHYLRNTISDSVCGIVKALGQPPYNRDND